MKARELVRDFDAWLTLVFALSVGLSVGLWLLSIVPFDAKTFALHLTSVAVGVAGGLIVYRRRR